MEKYSWEQSGWQEQYNKSVADYQLLALSKNSSKYNESALVSKILGEIKLPLREEGLESFFSLYEFDRNMAIKQFLLFVEISDSQQIMGDLVKFLIMDDHLPYIKEYAIKNNSFFMKMLLLMFQPNNCYELFYSFNEEEKESFKNQWLATFNTHYQYNPILLTCHIPELFSLITQDVYLQEKQKDFSNRLGISFKINNAQSLFASLFTDNLNDNLVNFLIEKKKDLLLDRVFMTNLHESLILEVSFMRCLYEQKYHYTICYLYKDCDIDNLGVDKAYLLSSSIQILSSDQDLAYSIIKKFPITDIEKIYDLSVNTKIKNGISIVNPQSALLHTIIEKMKITQTVQLQPIYHKINKI